MPADQGANAPLCPRCGAAMAHETSRPGAGWGGTGQYLVYRCPACGEGTELESAPGRQFGVALGALQLVLGALALWLLDPPANWVIGLILVVLGGFGIRQGWPYRRA